MSIDASRWAWTAEVQSSTQRLVLLSLADRAGEEHTAWPSIERLAKDTVLDKKTVQKVILELISLGLVCDTGDRTGPTKRVFNEESVAIIEAGVRERSLINFGDAGTIQGELGRTLFQFKGFPLAYMFRIGHRAFAQGDIKSRATFLASLLAYQTLAGALIVQTQNLVSGKNPEPVFTIDFFGKSILKGGGLSFLGDLMSALSDPTGRSASDFISGPLLGQSMKLGMLLTGMGNNFIEGKESTRMMEVANTLKGNIPLQNLWYSKLVVDRMLYSKLQNMIDPDYLPRTQQRLENLGNSYWWDLSE